MKWRIEAGSICGTMRRHWSPVLSCWIVALALSGVAAARKSSQGHRYFPWRLCHSEKPGELSRVLVRHRVGKITEEVEKKCRFCHKNLPPPPRSHPSYVRPSSRVKIPRDLPLDQRGRIVCCTCHDPHPGVRTPFMVRRRDVTQLCKACHPDIGL